MKKTWAILMGGIVGIVAVIALATMTTNAQEPTPAQDATQTPMQQNRRNDDGWNGRGPGMGMDDRGDCAPHGKPMGDMGRDAHLTVLADALRMTTDDLMAAFQEGKSIADIADEQGVAVDTVVDTLVTKAEEHLATLVEDGRLTQDEADSKLETIREEITTRINDTWTPGEKPGFAPDGGKKGRSGLGRGPGHGPIEDLAEALTMTTDDLMAAFQEGKSIADIADEQGVAVDTVVDTLVTKAEEHLATLVEDGRLTQDEADSKLETIREEITTRINETHTPRGPGMRF